MTTFIPDEPRWRWLRARLPSRQTPEEREREAASTATLRQSVEDSDGCCGISDVGLVRPGNEDAFFFSTERNLMIVADGLGGHAAGEVASAIAIDSICGVMLGEAGGTEPVSTLIDRALAQADADVRAHGQVAPEHAGLATTIVVAVLRDNKLSLVHVGDVRAYLCRNGRLQRLTDDHTIVGAMLRDGLIGEDEARHHPARNNVSRAVGAAQDVVAEHTSLLLEAGDVLLLCSDGLWDEVPHSTMAEILSDPSPALDLAMRLTDAALVGGGHDNVTALVYRHPHL